jgi:hypothetical protein
MPSNSRPRASSCGRGLDTWDRLQHRPRIAHVADLAGKATAAGIHVPDGPAFAVDVDQSRVLGVDRARVALPHELPHHAEQVDLAVVEEHLRVVDVGLADDHVAEVDVVDAVALAEPAADGHGILAHLPRDAAIEGHAVERALNQAQVLLPVIDGGHELLRPAAQGHGRIVRMEGQTDVRLLRLRYHRLQEAPGALELLGAGVGAHAVLGRQVPRDLVVVRRVSRAGAPRLLLVAFGQTVRVEVVLDDRQTGLPGGPDGGDHVRDLGVGSGPSPYDVVEPRDHHVVEGQAAGLELLDASADVGLAPRDLRAAREHVVDADLLHPPHPGLVHRTPEAETDLGCDVAFRRHPSEPRLGVNETKRERPRDGRGPDPLEGVSAIQATAHIVPPLWSRAFYGRITVPSFRRVVPHEWSKFGGPAGMGNFAASASSTSIPSPGRSCASM